MAVKVLVNGYDAQIGTCTHCYSIVEYNPKEDVRLSHWYIKYNDATAIIKYVPCPVCGNRIHIDSEMKEGKLV
jgi:hypothetical protein